MMNTGKAFFYSQNAMRHTTKSEFSVDGLKTVDLPRVEIVYSYADLGGETVDFLVGKGVKGIVLAGVGDGNSTDAVIAALEQAAKKGVAVVRSLARRQRRRGPQRRDQRRQARLYRRHGTERPEGPHSADARPVEDEGPKKAARDFWGILGQKRSNGV